ncbi:MAG: penicillin-binding protein 2 [Candidatus Marinimicrobia bacterium]|jgi:penicillin-binding protein 2|nr:penicillin-binding protein 2 [Candidatus Neomarinimicrobiota bacterium]MBT3496138.1 penicillin-binding protein 2 [Candidatus Neomarinimicrobiota bacterium]MBT3692707.1 penicillin-binding protein 2 [Candidatus Neomarinimicrobiota bacterium]MBT3731864.1 penicillin-binding protein 2 [Candidatus Neomarinimicrobiota bacterium]MBT4144574.1 penicillin-binding protein 2 [Candidatus Neomarinimicrobiota bacterium]
MLKAENAVTIRQYWVTTGIVIALLFLLLGRYFLLQIVNHDRYKTKANNNRIRTKTIPAPRGLILDRNGQIIVDNYPSYVLTATPGEMTDRPKQLALLASVINIDSKILSDNYKKYRRGQFVPARLFRDLSFDQISKVEENKRALSGISYEKHSERFYPGKAKLSHLIGFVKEVDKPIRERLNDPRDYIIGDLIGWSGIEKQFERKLKGTSGIEYLEVDTYGRKVGTFETLENITPTPGENFITTIDLDLQLFLENLMTKKKGAIIVSNALTGEILAAASAPDFPPELFTGVILPDEWNEIMKDPDNPLLNRMVQGLYQPGSITKMITAFALFENPEFDPSRKFNCSGFYQFGDRLFGCWLDSGHGNMDLKEAIEQSCDVYFYKTTQNLEVDHLGKWFRIFGFGEKTNLDFPIELKGLVPTKSYFNNRYGRYGWSKGALLNLAIGQGELLVTPMQIVKYINLLATHGNTPRVHLNRRNIRNLKSDLKLNADIWDYISESMYGVVNSEKGTGKKANIHYDNVQIYGKTGSAENPHGKTHAWFIGYAKNDQKLISVTILLENAGSGGSVAAPLAGKIFKYLFNDTSKKIVIHEN